MNMLARYQPQWIREDFVDFVLEQVNPMWSWKKAKAQVVAVEAVASDFYQVSLLPNTHFNTQQIRAGQSILVTLVLEGVHQQRSYSIMRSHPNGQIDLGVKVQGKVSRAISQLNVGQVIEISQPQGDFILAPAANRVLLIASGSGITAIYALLEQVLLEQSEQIDVVYFTRDDAFHAMLQQVADQHETVRYHHINTAQQPQHLSLDFLNQRISDLAQCQVYACGASAMMRAADDIFTQLGCRDKLYMEYFQTQVDESLEAQPVTFMRAQQQFEARGNLLESAEQAGLRPAHGCRMGICNTCTCTKVSGSTKNILTGEIDHGSNTQIKLCVSQAVSPVVINL